MRYKISGKQIDVGEALKTHVEQELASVVEKYAERPTDAHVVFSKEGPAAKRMKYMPHSMRAARRWKSSCAATSAG